MGSLIIANFNSCNRLPYRIRDVRVYKGPTRQGQGKPLPFSWNLFIWQCLLCFLVRPPHLRHRCAFPFENEKAPLPFYSYVVAPANENTVKPLIAATFAAKAKWPLFRGGRYSEVQQKFKPKHLTRFIAFFVVLMDLMRQYTRESGKMTKLTRTKRK